MEKYNPKEKSNFSLRQAKDLIKPENNSVKK